MVVGDGWWLWLWVSRWWCVSVGVLQVVEVVGVHTAALFCFPLAALTVALSHFCLHTPHTYTLTPLSHLCHTPSHLHTHTPLTDSSQQYNDDSFWEPDAYEDPDDEDDLEDDSEDEDEDDDKDAAAGVTSTPSSSSSTPSKSKQGSAAHKKKKSSDSDSAASSSSWSSTSGAAGPDTSLSMDSIKLKAAQKLVPADRELLFLGVGCWQVGASWGLRKGDLTCCVLSRLVPAFKHHMHHTLACSKGSAQPTPTCDQFAILCWCSLTVHARCTPSPCHFPVCDLHTHTRTHPLPHISLFKPPPPPPHSNHHQLPPTTTNRQNHRAVPRHGHHVSLLGTTRAVHSQPQVHGGRQEAHGPLQGKL